MPTNQACHVLAAVRNAVSRSFLLQLTPCPPCLQLREAAAAAMARHKAELPNQPMERAIDIPGEPPGRPAQHAKRAQRQYRQRGGEEEVNGAGGPGPLPSQAAGMAAASRMQEQEHEARARAKRIRGGFIGFCFQLTDPAFIGICCMVDIIGIKNTPRRRRHAFTTDCPQTQSTAWQL